VRTGATGASLARSVLLKSEAPPAGFGEMADGETI
jgi:hypothetical protein